MIDLNGNMYKLVLMDTCVISLLLKQTKADKSKIFDVIIKNAIPCITVHNIKELRRIKILYSKFCNMFRVIPSFILKEHDQLLSDEITNYSTGEKISPIIGPLFDNPFSEQKIVLMDYTDEILTGELMQKYGEDNKAILKGILSLIPNFPSKNRNYSIKEIDEFMWKVSIQQLSLRHTLWAKDLNDIGQLVDVNMNLLPSLRFMSYVLFYKFYITNRKPQISDIPDLIMSSVYPYMDIVILEKNQADITRQILRRHKNMPDLTVMSIKDFI